MNLALAVVTSFVAFVVIYEANGQFIEEKNMSKCFYTIVCDLRRPEEFAAMIRSAGPKLNENAFQWFRDISLIPEAEDTPEFWKSYPDKKCVHADDVKEDMFAQWIIKAGEFWSEVCEGGDEYECKKMEEAAKKWMEIMNKYVASGDCDSGLTDAGDKMKNMAGGGGFPAPPSFGK